MEMIDHLQKRRAKKASIHIEKSVSMAEFDCSYIAKNIGNTSFYKIYILHFNYITKKIKSQQLKQYFDANYMRKNGLWLRKERAQRVAQCLHFRIEITGVFNSKMVRVGGVNLPFPAVKGAGLLGRFVARGVLQIVIFLRAVCRCNQVKDRVVTIKNFALA